MWEWKHSIEWPSEKGEHGHINVGGGKIKLCEFVTGGMIQGCSWNSTGNRRYNLRVSCAPYLSEVRVRYLVVHRSYEGHLTVLLPPKMSRLLNDVIVRLCID